MVSNTFYDTLWRQRPLTSTAIKFVQFSFIQASQLLNINSGMFLSFENNMAYVLVLGLSRPYWLNGNYAYIYIILLHGTVCPLCASVMHAAHRASAYVAPCLATAFVLQPPEGDADRLIQDGGCDSTSPWSRIGCRWPPRFCEQNR